jgi:nicotinate phosphoribosyltransferase
MARIARLPDEFKRFVFPHEYKIGLSKDLKEQRDHLLWELRNQI